MSAGGAIQGLAAALIIISVALALVAMANERSMTTRALINSGIASAVLFALGCILMGSILGVQS